MSKYSNQSKLNEYSSFLPSTGINFYGKNNITAVSTTLTETVSYDVTNIESDTESFSFDGSVVTILKSGLYAISASVVMEDAVDPQNNDIDYGCFLLVNCVMGSTGYSMECTKVSGRIPARGVSVGSEKFVTSVSTTVYLGKDSTVRVRLTNFSTHTLNAIAESELQVQRIA